MLRIKHPSWNDTDEHNLRGVVVAMLMDPRNEGHGVVSQAEIEFGSHAFDTHFSHIPLDNLLGVISNYANDEGDFGLKDFLGTVAEYQAMPCSSLSTRMKQAAMRACR